MKKYLKYNINELIDLYFRGETSIEEENILKEYFSTGDIKEEHQEHQALFTYFSIESHNLSEIKEDSPIKSFIKPKKILVRFRIAIFSATAIVLIALMLRPLNYQDEKHFELIIDGNIIDNQELAIEIASRELQKIKILTRGLHRSVDKIETIREQTNNSLKPLEKIIAQNKKY